MHSALRHLLDSKLEGNVDDDQTQLRSSITAQLLVLRAELSSLLVENHEAVKQLRADMEPRLQHAISLHSDLERVLHSLTKKRDEKASFQFSEGARTILAERGLLEDVDQQHSKRTTEDEREHAAKLQALQQEKEQRLALMRRMHRLQADKRDKQRRIAELKRYLNGLPAVVSKLDEALGPLSAGAFNVGPSGLSLPSSFQSLPPALRRIHARLCAYKEAYEDEALLRSLLGSDHLRVEFQSDSSRPYIMLVKCKDDRPSVQLTHGPSKRSSVNQHILQLLYDDDVSHEGAFKWVSVLCNGTPAQVVDVIQKIEGRFKAQRYLLPQLALLMKRKIPEMASFAHLSTYLKSAKSHLVKFQAVTAPSNNTDIDDLSIRKFVAKFELRSHTMTASISVDARYPQVLPRLHLQVTGVASSAIPAYARTSSLSPPGSVVVVEGEELLDAAFDPQFHSIEEQVNDVADRRDDWYVLSYQLARAQLGFETYVNLKSGQADFTAAKRRGKDRGIISMN